MRRLTKDKHVYDLDPDAPPAMTIESGEELIVETWDVFQGLQDSESIHQRFELGPDPSALPIPATGPIYVQDAMPGDALKIDFIHITPIDHAIQRQRPGSGYLDEEFPDIHVTFMPIEGDHLVFPGGIRIPLSPDMGMVATTPTYVLHPSGRIGPHGGDIDLHDLGEGTTLYLPVLVPGGLLVMGDGHAAAGEATMAGTAAEAQLDVHIRVTLEKGRNLMSPRALTKHDFVILGHGKNDGDLTECLTRAVKEMLEVLVDEKGMKPNDAYALLSVAGSVVGPASNRRLYMSSPKVTLARQVYEQLG